MLSVDEAQSQILSEITAIGDIVQVKLEDSLNAVLAEDLVAKVSVPPADNSAMDGYALSTKDFEEQRGQVITISQRITAGTPPLPLEPGTAARIFTGAEIPLGADAVVIQEDTTTDGKTVTILEQPRAGENVRPLGQDICKGNVVIHKGTRLDARHIGLAAAAGFHGLKVFRPVKVVIVNTGNELLEPGSDPEAGKIYNSNGPMLLALLQKIGCEIIEQIRVADTLDATQAALERAAEQADLVLSTGGVSVGEEDHIKAAVGNLGQLNMWKVKLKPGKPLAFGRIGGTPFMGLPGNPVSSFVTFLLFATPLIKTLQGEAYSPPQSFWVPLQFSLTSPRRRPEFMRVKLGPDGAEKFSNQSSGVLTSVAWADGLAKIPADTCFEQGDLIEVIPFYGIL